MPSNIFKDKVAIITGSSRGIGKATAIELLKFGATVILNGRNQERLTQTEKELKALGGNVFSVCCDVTIPLQAKELIEKGLKAFGKIDILINNVGINMRGNFSDIKPEAFKAILETNIMGVVNTTIPALPHIKETQGSIVFISSLAGIRGLPGLSSYCSSKMALRALAESIRIEEVKSKIHVGLIYVGLTENEVGKKIMEADGSLSAIKERSQLIKLQKLNIVARAIVKNVRKRKFVTTLTGLGKLNAIMQAIMPWLVEKILIHVTNKIKKIS